MKNKKQNIVKGLVIGLVICLIAGFLFTRFGKQNAEPDQDTDSGFSITGLIDSAKGLKNDLLLTLQDLKNNNLESARSRIQNIPENIRTIRNSIDYATSLFNGSVPLVQSQLDNIRNILDAGDMAVESLMLPAVDLLEAYPLSEITVGDAINVELLCKYLDFVETAMPDVEYLMECVNAVDFSIIDSEGKIQEYLTLANQLLDLYRENAELVANVRAMMGNGEDRLYVIVAQSSSEIRASGGFPGSIGSIRIQDGLLTLGDFKGVNSVLSYYLPSGLSLTKEEYRLFNFLSGMNVPRDSDLCPDFTRVGEIWAKAYEARNGESVDGVISMTPVIVQRLLAVLDAEITLSDGTTMNGENASWVIQHDLYFKYFSRGWVSSNNDIADALFAEAAQLAMGAVMDGLSADNIQGYLSVAQECFADRTLMVWMKDEELQAFIVEMNWDAGLNTDPAKPEAGVYFNGTMPSKVGMFLLLNTEMGEAVQNPDGSCTYPITVTFSNNITEEEIASASTYITNGMGGAIQGAAYFFAPAGGSISDIQVSNGTQVSMETYNGLSLGFIRQMTVKPNEIITVTYSVTTAPEATEPLVFSKTPTVQEFSLS